MAEIRINATGGVKLYDADDSHYAQILAGTISSNVDALTLGSSSADFNIPVKVLGTTPTLTIGDAGAEDTKIVFDGNAQDFYIALDDSADDLLIGLGSTVGTTPAISINEDRDVTISDGAIDFDVASHDGTNGLKLGGTLVTTTAAEMNLLDGGTSVGSSITVADADGFVVNDGGTMKTIPATDITTYAGHTFAGCSLSKTTEQSNISADSDVVITWEAEVYDTDSFHDTGSNTSRITIPSAFNGKKAVFTAHLYFDALDDGGGLSIRIFKNGAATNVGTHNLTSLRIGSASGAHIIGGITAPIALATNDYFEVVASTNESDVDIKVSALGSSTTYYAGFSMEICPGI